METSTLAGEEVEKETEFRTAQPAGLGREMWQ